ncbi:hypothetical protein CUMW_175720, partial [Citrus unshiu]
INTRVLGANYPYSFSHSTQHLKSQIPPLSLHLSFFGFYFVERKGAIGSYAEIEFLAPFPPPLASSILIIIYRIEYLFMLQLGEANNCKSR